MPNPYLQNQANDIATNLTQNWQQNALPSINSGAMMAGGFGGSRQGVAQGIAANGLNQAIGQAQTGLYANAYNTDQQLQAQRDMQAAQLAAQQNIAGMQNQTQRDLGFGGLTNQRYGMDQNYNVNLGQLGLGLYNAETGRGLGHAQLAMQGDQNAFNNQLAGYNAQINGLNALQGWNSQGVNLANQQQQIPIQNLGALSNIGTSIGNQGGSSSTPGPSMFQNGLAGGLTLAQLYKIISGG